MTFIIGIYKMNIEKLEDLSKWTVKDNNETYREYHEEFCRKSLCEKIWLILKALPMHLYNVYWAPENQKYLYLALRTHLEKSLVR
jgi:hypothetical protein